jgi:REP element-mobilizing transposase RayT
MNRGVDRDLIFRTTDDWLEFLRHLGRAAKQSDLEIHAYALMPNHFHLLLRSWAGELSKGMAFLSGRFAQRFNWRWGRDGPLFRGRFKSVLVENELHLDSLLAYIHLNPVRAGIVKSLNDVCGTSHRAYLGLDQTPSWLFKNEFLSRLRGREGVAQWVIDHYRKRLEFSEDFLSEVAMFGGTEVVPSPFRSKAPRKAVVRPLEAHLEEIAKIAGATPGAFLRVERGPGANPVRRFAACALVEEGNSSLREIGEVLGMSGQAVSKMASRVRMEAPLSEPLRSWISDLRAAKESRVQA